MSQSWYSRAETCTSPRPHAAGLAPGSPAAGSTRPPDRSAQTPHGGTRAAIAAPQVITGTGYIAAYLCHSRRRWKRRMFKNGMARSKASHQANVEPHSALTPIGRDNHTAERTRDGSSSLRQQQWIVWGVGSYQRQVAMRIVALESLNARMVFMNDLLIIFTGTHRALQSCSFSPQVLHAKVVLSAAPPAVGDVTAGLLARYLLAHRISHRRAAPAKDSTTSSHPNYAQFCAGKRRCYTCLPKWVRV